MSEPTKAAAQNPAGKPEPRKPGASALLTGLHCAECKREFNATFSSTGKLTLQHPRGIGCVNDAKHFECPTVKLQELKL